jgi:prophage antirepressor-like protein
MELINCIDETISFNENNIRIIGSYNEPWFVAKDVCQILDIKDVSMALTKIPEKWKGTKVIGTLGGNQDMRIINEAGLYKLIMRSNKLIAQKFQEAVCEDILPSLRRKGEYKLKTLLDEKNKELEIIEKKNQELNFKISLKNANFRKGKSLYVGSNTVDEENFKVGIANDVNIRLGTLNTSTSTDFVVWKTWITRFSKEIEDAVKKNYADYRIHVERKEFYKMTAYQEIIAYIDKLVTIFNETDRYEEIDGELLLDKIKVDKKVCTKCLKYLQPFILKWDTQFLT